jgi:hypothetical protein
VGAGLCAGSPRFLGRLAVEVLHAFQDASDALAYLGALRADIEGYRLAIRAPDRPPKQTAGRRRRGGKPSVKTVSVTVSIGVAARVCGTTPRRR